MRPHYAGARPDGEVHTTLISLMNMEANVIYRQRESDPSTQKQTLCCNKEEGGLILDVSG